MEKQTLKGKLWGLRQFLVTERPLKIIKSTFQFNIKTRFLLDVTQFLMRILGHVEKRLNNKAKVNLKMYEVTNWIINNFTHIVQYLKK